MVQETHPPRPGSQKTILGVFVNPLGAPDGWINIMEIQGKCPSQDLWVFCDCVGDNRDLLKFKIILVIICIGNKQFIHKNN